LPAIDATLTTMALRCSAPAARSSSSALAVEEHDRAHVDRELEVDELRLVVGRRAPTPDAGVVHEHVEAAEARRWWRATRSRDRLVVGDVRRDGLDVGALGAQSPSAACSSDSGLRAATVRA
jgi:hypothetical protein